MLNLDAATVLLQWSVGGLLFLWVTSRRREVGIGYGWLLRSVYGLMAVGAAVGFINGGIVVLPQDHRESRPDRGVVVDQGDGDHRSVP